MSTPNVGGNSKNERLIPRRQSRCKHEPVQRLLIIRMGGWRTMTFRVFRSGVYVGPRANERLNSGLRSMAPPLQRFDVSRWVGVQTARPLELVEDPVKPNANGRGGHVHRKSNLATCLAKRKPTQEKLT